MATNLKQEIIDKARILFSARGYNDVSLRDIAAALEISPGNLTYHFRKKEDIIEAVVLDIRKTYQPYVPPKTLQELDTLIQHTQVVREKHTFYFLHYVQLAQISEVIRKIQKEAKQESRMLWLATFENLKEVELIKTEAHPGQHQNLATIVQVASTYWPEPIDAEINPVCESAGFQDCIWDIFLPSLTDKGMEIYRQEISKFK